MLIATLIAAGRLDDRLVDRALGLLRELDPKARFGGWIDEGDAVDLRVSADLRAVRWALESLPEADVVVQPDESRFKKLLVADMDSTVIGQECIDELADFAGLKREVAEITERAMQGKIDFKAALRERVALLSGLEEDAIARCLAERVVPSPGAATLVRTMRVGGASAVLVEAGENWREITRSGGGAANPRFSSRTRCANRCGKYGTRYIAPMAQALTTTTTTTTRICPGRSVAR